MFIRKKYTAIHNKKLLKIIDTVHIFTDLTHTS